MEILFIITVILYKEGDAKAGAGTSVHFVSLSTIFPYTRIQIFIVSVFCNDSIFHSLNKYAWIFSNGISEAKMNILLIFKYLYREPKYRLNCNFPLLYFNPRTYGILDYTVELVVWSIGWLVGWMPEWMVNGSLVGQWINYDNYWKLLMKLQFFSISMALFT